MCNLVSGALLRSLGHSLGMPGKTADITARVGVCVCGGRLKVKNRRVKHEPKENEKKKNI